MCLLGVTFFYTERLTPETTVPKLLEKIVVHKKVSPEPVKMLFVGDIMLDRTVAISADQKGTDSLFLKVQDLLAGADVTVGNLEGPITDKPSVAKKDFSILRFTFDPKFAQVLKNYGFSALSLANNHSLDFGRDGYDQTTNYLQNVDMAFFGSYLNDKNISTSMQMKEKNICLVGYHDLFTHDPVPVIDEITRIRLECDYVVLFAHWGEEYQKIQGDRQTKLAHEFIDAGADLVIGAHPHVVQPVEIYKNKAIFYSLGNFMFDQNFSFATRHGLAIEVEWSEEKTDFKLVPVAINEAEVEIANETDGARVIRDVLAEGLLSPETTSSILNSWNFVLEN